MPTGPTKELNGELRAKAREGIASGRLPRAREFEALFAGFGDEGCACDLCGARITREQVEYEVSQSARAALHFHITCHTAWVLESVDASRPAC